MKTISIFIVALISANAFAVDYKGCNPQVAQGYPGYGGLYNYNPYPVASITDDGDLFISGDAKSLVELKRGEKEDAAVFKIKTPMVWGEFESTTTYKLKKKNGRPEYMQSILTLKNHVKPGANTGGFDLSNPKPVESKTHYKYDEKDLCYIDRMTNEIDGKETLYYDNDICDAVVKAGHEHQIHACVATMQELSAAVEAGKKKAKKDGLIFGMIYGQSEKSTASDIIDLSSVYISCSYFRKTLKSKGGGSSAPFAAPFAAPWSGSGINTYGAGTRGTQPFESVPAK